MNFFTKEENELFNKAEDWINSPSQSVELAKQHLANMLNVISQLNYRATHKEVESGRD